MTKRKRWVYGRADDRAMDEDRLEGTAANIQGGGADHRRSSGKGCSLFGLVLLGGFAVGTLALAVGYVSMVVVVTFTMYATLPILAPVRL